MNPMNSTGTRQYKEFKSTTPKGYETFSQRQFDPQQMALYNQTQGFLGPESYLQRLAGGDEELFKQIEAPALRQFSGLQQGLANKYSGAGMGARKGSGFQNAMNEYGSNFALQLQGQRQNLQQGALSDLMRYSQMLLNQRPYERGYVEKPVKQPYGDSDLNFGDVVTGAMKMIPFVGPAINSMQGWANQGDQFYGPQYGQNFVSF